MSSNNNRKALKSGVWYTAANFITKSIGLITTPIFTRLLSHEDYGLFSNYLSWQSVFIVFATLNLTASFMSAKYDYKDDFDGYILSSLSLSSLVTIAWLTMINLFPSFAHDLTGLDIRLINIMYVYILLHTAIDMFQAREIYNFEYKISVATSLFVAISTAALSVILVIFMENKLLGRVVGNSMPTVLVGGLLYAFIIVKGKRITVSYWRYALPICLPYIPHILSLYLLNSMDKMMITKMCGAEDNAMYSVAYSCGAIITLFLTSMNTAFQPWLADRLNEEEFNEIKRVSKWYVILFAFLACGAMLLSPELILIMGGKSYGEALYVMPPVAFGCVCQFMYTMYVNIEQFYKKTVGMAFASVAAAISNFVLNSFFIPRYGYIAAAYTTLASFALLLLLHMLLVKHMNKQNIYPTKTIFLVLIIMSLYTLAIKSLYMHYDLRYCIIVVYAGICCFLIIRYKEIIINAIIKRK